MSKSSRQFKCRVISKGVGEGEALVCSQPIGFNFGVDVPNGVIIEKGHELEGVSFTNKVLIFPHGKGSTGGSYVLYQVAKEGTGPAAMINLHTETILTAGAIMGRIPVVDRMQESPFDVIQTGDYVQVDAVSGAVNVIPKNNPEHPTNGGKPEKFVTEATGDDRGGMALTDEQKEMLAGKRGEPLQVAMEMLCALGNIYGADKLIPLKSAHIAGLSLKSHGIAGMEWAEDMARKGAKVVVPTTCNVIGLDRSRDLGLPKDWCDHQMRIGQAYADMGCYFSSTCVPYYCGFLPKHKESIAWAESSAVVFSNSVLGARDNREGGPSAWAAALVGATPNYGLHLDENRKGDILFKVNVPPKNITDYGAIGNYVGKMVGEKIPVFEGLGNPTIEDLVYFGSALASSGSVALFHAIGITPEAPDLKTVFGDKKYEVVELGEAEIAQGYKNLNCGKNKKIDYISIGCPHYSLNQIREIALKLKGKKVHPDVAFWIHTNIPIKQLAIECGYADMIEQSGAILTQDLCTILSTPESIGFKVMATNSPKIAFYSPGNNKLEVWYGTEEQCIEAAVSGYWV